MDLEERLQRLVRSDARSHTIARFALLPATRASAMASWAIGLAAAVGVGLAVAFALTAARQQVASPSPSMALSAVATSVPSPSPSSSEAASSVGLPTIPSPPPCNVGTGQLEACPGSGPVGTVVTLSDHGWGCSGGRAGFSTIIVFEGHPESGAGTEGGQALPTIHPDAGGAFSTTFVIPAVLEPFHGQGGGPTVPGTYSFVGRPPDCAVNFLVTP